MKYHYQAGVIVPFAQKFYKQLILAVAAIFMATVAVMGLQASAATHLMNPFTAAELSTWETDRQFPSGGVNSVSFDGRDNVAQIGVVAEDRDSNPFRHFEGIKKVDDFGTDVQVDLYVPSVWQEAAVVNVGFWASDDPITAYPLIVYRNGATVDAGFYVYNTVTGAYITSGVEVNYDGWNTLSIALDTNVDAVNYSINGQSAGSSFAGSETIGQVFLNHYNDGVRDYVAYWHAGVEELPPAKAAPAVATELLKDSSINNRYGNGRTGGNHVADVAKRMGPGTEFDGVAKEDVEEYECAIVKFLRGRSPSAMVSSSYDNCYESVQTVEVPGTTATGETTEELADGVEYRFVANGTYEFATWAGDPYANAKCSFRGTADPLGLNGQYVDGADLPNPYTNYLQIWVDASAVEWQGECSMDNDTFTYDYTGTGSAVNLWINDGGSYGDNTGSLTVEIFKKL